MKKLRIFGFINQMALIVLLFIVNKATNSFSIILYIFILAEIMYATNFMCIVETYKNNNKENREQ